MACRMLTLYWLMSPLRQLSFLVVDLGRFPNVEDIWHIYHGSDWDMGNAVEGTFIRDVDIMESAMGTVVYVINLLFAAIKVEQSVFLRIVFWDEVLVGQLDI